ncbi:MAG: lantibiotic dehydratase C-terminal domain-containing protein [Nannocystaceae bacterium]
MAAQSDDKAGDAVWADIVAKLIDPESEASPVLTDADDPAAAGNRLSPFARGGHGRGRQLNLELVPIDGSMIRCEREVLRALEPALARARLRGVESFSCLHQSPGLRLTFIGAKVDADVLAEVTATVDRLYQRGLVSRAIGCLYEPDIHAFGGPAAAVALMRYFDADTTAWLTWERNFAEQPPFPVSALAFAVIDDLFSRSLASRDEVASAWLKLANRYRAYRGVKPATKVVDLSSLITVGGARAGAITRGYALANQRLCADLQRIELEGGLRASRSRLLVMTADLHCNRLRLLPDEIVGLARSRAAGLRGDPDAASWTG